MWLMIGEENWVRTTAVVSVLSDESDHVVVVRTTDARYRFVFDDAPPAPTPIA